MAETTAPIGPRDRQRATDAAVKEILGLERQDVLKKTERLREQRLAVLRDQPAPTPPAKAKAKARKALAGA